MCSMKKHSFDTVIEELEKYHPNATTGFKMYLSDHFFEIGYKKGTRILNYKQVQESGLFIYKGSAMELSVNPVTLEETASNFWFEKDFPFTTPGLFSRAPSPAYIILLEDTLFVGISFQKILSMRNEFPEIEIIIEAIRSHYERLKHEFEQQFRYPAKYRVKLLEAEHSNIYNLTDLKYIAQYLRINAKTLSRLRGK
jgi:CRP-like cAMP-binding protein